MDSIQGAWKRIRRWYQAEVGSNEVMLAQGASSNEIASLETVVGASLPNEVKESYQLHNGSAERGIFPYGYYLLSLEEIVQEWRIWEKGVKQGYFQGMKSSPKGPARTEWWNVKWIPFTASGGGDHHCIDLAPAKGGRVGQVIEFSHETGVRCVAASGLAQWLTRFADALGAGRYRYDEDSRTLLPVDEEG